MLGHNLGGRVRAYSRGHSRDRLGPRSVCTERPAWKVPISSYPRLHGCHGLDNRKGWEMSMSDVYISPELIASLAVLITALTGLILALRGQKAVNATQTK